VAFNVVLSFQLLSIGAGAEGANRTEG
jgi:hypothetical protein